MSNNLPSLTHLRLHLLRIAAAGFLTAEKLLLALWPLLLWLCAFSALWLLQIPDMFGSLPEILVEVIFLIGFCVLLSQAIARFTLPHHGEVTRRIEEDSALLHRPLSGLEDKLANPAEERTEHLWSFWQERLLPTLQSLRWPKPRPVLPGMDPYALRGLAVIVLIGALVIAGPTWRQRIGHGMMPVTPSFMKTSNDNIVLWVTPPAYTGQPQIVLKGSGSKDIVMIPEGSIIKARVKSRVGKPSLDFDDQKFPMERFDKRNYGIEKTAQPGKILSVHQWIFSRARWLVNYVPDLPPTLSQKGQPQVMAKGEIKIPLSVQDDYGVETVTAHITLDPSVTPPPIGTPVDDIRNVVSPPKTAMDFAPQFELAWHPWAGMPVVMDIEARDHKGQVATIKGLKITLPERHFRHPLAHKLVELRRRLIWSPDAAAMNVAYEIGGLMTHPALYQGNPVVFLSMRSMVSHLIYKKGAEEVSKVVAQLWDTALKIEDGNFSMAQRDLRKAQAELQAALRDPNSTPDQIAQLMDNMRQAMGAYLNETFREMQKQMAANGADPNMLNAENFMKAINPDTLVAMLDKMQAQAMSGDRNEAQKMLSQMQKLMEGLDPSNMQSEMPKDMQEMARQVGEIQKLIEKQKTLITKTQDPKSENLKPEQEALRQTLIDLMQAAAEKLDKVPDGMGKAEIQMRGSSQALGDNKKKESVPFQEQAVKDLSEGQQQMSQKLAERMASMMMFSFGQGSTDPLGRPMGDNDEGQPGSGSKVKIPDKAERKKIQDILEQLRKKSGELARPDYELDYYRRLMRQF